MYMKAIQVSFDERLLERLDRDAEVKRIGRSAVLRNATVEYLRRKAKERIAEQYERAYGKSQGLGGDWDGWEDAGEWPRD
jgi:metal-responsive CopG/Arc/MetJ family transcriptional regulator